VLAAQAKSIEYFYDDRNRAEVVRILIAVSSQKADDVEKSTTSFERTISSTVPARFPAPS
jgi:hypothetical protein